MTIGERISLACMALVALTIILGTGAALNISHMNTEVLSIVEGPLPGIYSIGLIQGYVNEQKVTVLQHVIRETPGEMNKLESTIAELESKLQAEMKVYE